MKILWIFGVGGFLLLIISLIMERGMGVPVGYGNMMMGGMLFYGMFYFIFVASLISFIFSIIFKEVWKGDLDNDTIDTLSILKSRYAKGEISKEQFETMKKDLSA